MHRMHAGPCSPEVMLHRGDSACSVASLQSLHDRQMGSRREGHSPKARLVVTVIEVRWGCHVNLAPAEREVEGLALVQAAVAARQL